MEIFWIVACNILAIGVMYIIQAYESKAKRIPRHSKKFLYLQDWYTTTWGDIVGLSIFDAAVVPQILGGVFSFQYVIFSFLFGFLFTTACFAYFLSPNHRPDAGVPRKSVLSANGVFHAVYFFFQASIGAYGIALFVTGNLPNGQLVLALCGALVYFSCFLGDLKRFLPK